MSNTRENTVARVQVTVELFAGSWGPECKLDQVYRQASEAAINRIRRELRGVDIIGVPKILAITTERQS